MKDPPLGIRKSVHHTLGIIQAFVALGAIPAGVMLVLDTSGESLGMSTSMLGASPFGSFLIPGILLLVVNGLLNAVAAILTFQVSRHSGAIAISLGAFLVFWIIVQIYYLGPVHFLQVLYLVIGVVEFTLGYKLLKHRHSTQSPVHQ